MFMKVMPSFNIIHREHNNSMSTHLSVWKRKPHYNCKPRCWVTGKGNGRKISSPHLFCNWNIWRVPVLCILLSYFKMLYNTFLSLRCILKLVSLTLLYITLNYIQCKAIYMELSQHNNSNEASQNHTGNKACISLDIQLQ